MNDDTRFDERRSAAWREAIVENASLDRAARSPKRVALVVTLVIAAVAVSGGSIAYAVNRGLLPSPMTAVTSSPTPIERDTPSVTVTPTPAPTQTAAETPVSRLNGFDLAQVYAACDAAVPDSVFGPGGRWLLQPSDEQSFGLASSEVYVRDAAASDPNAIYADVVYRAPDGTSASFAALCIATGDPTDPTVTFVRTLD
jgi:hypothetical protein